MNKFKNKSIEELKALRKELAKEFTKASGVREVYLRRDIREIEEEIKRRA